MAKKSKNQLRRERAKLKRQELEVPSTKSANELNNISNNTIDFNKEKINKPGDKSSDINTDKETDSQLDDIVIENATVDIIPDDPNFQDFKRIFSKFQPVEENEDEDEDDASKINNNNGIGEVIDNNEQNDIEDQDDDDDDDEDENQVKKLSKRQLKKTYKLPLAILKSESKNPKLVEWIDTDSADPRFLVYLKNLHNIVEIPRHWSSKGDYLSSKKGIEKPPFELPKFILDTGILEMRNTTESDNSTLKQRMRERVQPKSGQLDMDFNKLYDAFFKNQKKPKLLKFGELYYEGLEDHKDININTKINSNSTLDSNLFRVGILSKELRTALGINDTDLPPWVKKLSTLGAPPSYPYMNLSDGTLIDENEKTLIHNIGNPIESVQWGKIESDEEDDDDEDEDEDEEDGNDENSEDENDNDEELEDAQILKEGDIPIESIGEDAPTRNLALSDEDDEPGTLFRILKETKSKRDGFMGKDALSYDISAESDLKGKRKRDDQENDIENDTKKLHKSSGDTTKSTDTKEKFRF
ncbi:unnamed protein product [[Candida] boidinii]|uniref:Unnamed protein product n=1 Tax=Candida boidinii TaxID=5477 RepID=A0ACB5TLL7_CANBO|nr:unnamed protein product [[Candida] boidinii]